MDVGVNVVEFFSIERQIKEGEMLLQKLYLEDEGMKEEFMRY